MHILVTADTVGGVWTYTQELVSGLTRRGHRVTLVSFGAMPQAYQTAWMTGLPGLEYRPTDFRLEWMQDSERDVRESTTFLESIVREVQPDVLHLNQYCYGSISADVPRIVVAHSDVVSWWVGVYGTEPEDSSWLRWYRETVTRGLRSADVVVAPSQWMLDAICRHYLQPVRGRVVYNGRSPELFKPSPKKENFVLSVGRLWDRAKQMSLLLEREQSVPVCIVGSHEEPGKVSESTNGPRPAKRASGAQSPEQLRKLFGDAALYAATSCYEPFGLAPVEAAMCGCALIANDIPVFRELWGEAAYYFRTNDADDLAAAVTRMCTDLELQQEYRARAYATACRRFAAAGMIDQYESIYRSMTSAVRAA